MLSLRSLWVPVLVPFDFSLDIEWNLLLDHVAAVHDTKAGMLLFSPAAEGEALSVAEKVEVLTRLARYPCHAQAILPATTCQTLPESIELTQTAVLLGYGTVQLRIPTTHAAASEASLSRFFIEVMERVPADARFVLERPVGRHAPVFAAVARRLADAYPHRIAGAERGGADTTPEGLPRDGTLTLQPGKSGQPGGAPVTADVALLGNMMADRYLDRDTAGAAEWMNPLKGLPAVAGIKHMLSRQWRRSEWTCVRPPLQVLSNTQRQRLDRWMSRTGQK
jgi:dihydrodipicolinate synthase/N-acetylneuraminate lyase